MPVPFPPRAAIWLRPPSPQGLAASLLQSSITKAGAQGPEEGHMQCPAGRASEQSGLGRGLLQEFSHLRSAYKACAALPFW